MHFRQLFPRVIIFIILGLLLSLVSGVSTNWTRADSINELVLHNNLDGAQVSMDLTGISQSPNQGGNITWIQDLTFPRDATITEILPADDGTILIRIHYSIGTALLKISPLGEIIWHHSNRGFGRMHLLPDGSFLSFKAGVPANVMRIDSKGNILWERIITGINILHTTDVQLPENEFQIMGEANTGCSMGGCGTYFPLALRIGINGTIRWVHEYGNFLRLFDNTVLADGTFVAAGYNLGLEPGFVPRDASLEFLDTEGNIYQRFYYPSHAIESVQGLPDGGFLAAGSAIASDNGYPVPTVTFDCWVGRYDENHNPEWETKYSSANSNPYKIASQLISLSDGNFVFRCPSNSGTILTKIDSDGNVLWARIYDTAVIESIVELQSAMDGGFYVAGAVTDPAGNQHARLLKLTNDGALPGCAIAWTNVVLSRNNYHPAMTVMGSSGLASTAPEVPENIYNISQQPPAPPSPAPLTQTWVCDPPTYDNKQFLPLGLNQNHLLGLDFGEPAGSTTFADASPFHHDATCQGNSCPTVSNGALSFDGSNDFLTFGNPDRLNQWSDEITLEAWIRPTATNGIRNIIAHGHNMIPEGELYLRIINGQYDVGSWDGTGYDVQAAIPAGDLNSWVHLVGTFDGTHWRLYRNGVEVASEAAAVGPIAVYADWAIGARGDGSERYFAGDIDNVSIFGRALSTNEIQERYQAGR